MSQSKRPTPNANPFAEFARLARAALARKDYREGLRLLNALEALSPRIGNRLSLSFCHLQLEELPMARDWCLKALELDPGNEKALNRLACLGALLGELEVRDEKALSAESWDALGVAQYHQGNFGFARKLFELAIEADPDSITAYFHLAELVREEDIDPWLARLKAHPPTGSEASPPFHFVLAILHDRKGDYRRAMELFKVANDLQYALSANAYNAEHHAHYADAIIRWFSAARLAELREQLAFLAPSTRRLAFVVGMPRTGSTLISRILSADPSVTDLGEAQLLPECISALGRRLHGTFPRILNYLDDSGWQRLQQCYLGQVSQGDGLVVDKNLANFHILGVVHVLFPGSRVIHPIRDRDDIMISCYKRLFAKGVHWSYNIGQMTHYYDTYLRLMRHWHEVLPEGAIHDVVYRDLVEDPQTEIAKLAAYCELGPELAERQFHQRRGVVKTASAQQVRKPIYKDALGSFERYRPYISFG